MYANGINKVCPVVRAINEIHGGGLYVDDDSQANIIKFDGCEYVCDDTSYEINLRLMEVARLELTATTINQYEQKIDLMFGYLRGRNRECCYRKLIDASQMKKLLLRQFVRTIDSISSLEEWLTMRVLYAAKKGENINVTLPALSLLPDADMRIIYSPRELTRTMNAIINYIRRLNINALLTKPLEIKPDLLPDFEPKNATNLDDLAPEITHMRTIDECKLAINSLLKFERETADYVRDIERYHCKVLNGVNSIHEIVRMIIEDTR